MPQVKVKLKPQQAKACFGSRQLIKCKYPT